MPKDISPGAAARRSLLVDSAAAAVLVVSALVFCAGLGIVGVIALSTLLLLAPWCGVEAWIGLVRRRRDKAARRATRRRPQSSAEPPLSPERDSNS